jgi:hypothetical protein
MKPYLRIDLVLDLLSTKESIKYFAGVTQVDTWIFTYQI